MDDNNYLLVRLATSRYVASNHKREGRWTAVAVFNTNVVKISLIIDINGLSSMRSGSGSNVCIIYVRE